MPFSQSLPIERSSLHPHPKKMRIFPTRLLPPAGTSGTGRMSSQAPPAKAPQLKDILDAIPADGITIDNLMVKFWKRTLSDHSKAELIGALDPIATLDAATGLWKPRPRHNLIPSHVHQMISRPRRRQRVSPFSSEWISGTGEVITHVRGEYNPVWRKHGVRGLLPKQSGRMCYRNVCVQVLLNSSPAFLAFLDIHKTERECGMRDCLTCSLADLAEQYTKSFTFTLSNVLNSFYGVCEKVFWGPRARAKRRVGPLSELDGDLDVRFLCFLLYNMREQLLKYPSDFQEFERLFMVEEQHTVTCSEGHIAQSNLIQRFQLRLQKGNRTSTDAPLNRSSLTPIAKAERRGTMDPPCAFCESTDTYTEDGYYLRKPELLIIRCPFRSVNGTMTWEEFAYGVSLEEEICLRPNDEERYVLVGATFVTGDSWKAATGHVMAAVRAPNGNITIIDDNHVYARGPRWSNVEALQSRSNPLEILLPHLLIYRRKYEAPPALPSYLRGSISIDPRTEKTILAMKLALPHIDPQDLLWEYNRADESIQKTIDYFLMGRDVEKEVSLDDVIPGYLEDVMKAYVRYPQLGVKKIYQTIQANHGNFDYATKQLEDFAGQRINYSSSEHVGDAGFEVNLDVVDDTFVDGQAQVTCRKTKKVKTARLLGILVEPEAQPPDSPAWSPPRPGPRSPRSPARRSARGKTPPQG